MVNAKSIIATLDSSSAEIKLRLGLCCQFVEHPVKFRTTTAAYALRLSKSERLKKISQVCLQNAESLLSALRYCADHGIGCFRINSQILPVKTHPAVGYSVDELPECEAIINAFRACGSFAREYGVRTVFHPDQFVVLNSPRSDVVRKSVAELEYQAEVADWVGADVINIHAGGAYGDKTKSLEALQRNLELLSANVRRRLTFENDDRTYSPADLLPACLATEIPLVYDVHHHRCLTDSLTIEQATVAAIATWNREPVFHISSPRCGWTKQDSRPHHDYISMEDFPTAWRRLAVTVEVEAKAKELAVLRLRSELAKQARFEVGSRNKEKVRKCLTQ